VVGDEDEHPDAIALFEATAAARSRSSRRAVMTRSKPCAANTSANASPMPDEAPVIKAVGEFTRDALGAFT
jgi:hypothetical protein